jgi:HEAT repeat protein/beta-lactamase regulating signal transducer with metallopeptidase domain
VSTFDVLLAQPLARGIGLGLVHSLWQGALIGLLAQAAWLVLDRRSAASRYAVGLTALLLMLLLPIVTVWGLGVPTADSREPWARPDPVPVAPGVSAPATGFADRIPGADLLASATVIVQRVAPRLVPVWLLGVALFALRLLGGWAVIRRRLSAALPCPEEWRERFTELAERMKVTPTVRLFATASVDVPMVAGWLAPVVLVPASMMAGLGPRQLESILAHELAHVRRHDYLVNIGQSVIESLLFYHPAVWWVSRRVRAEREHCCDDLAAAHVGDPIAYARALVELETRRRAVPHGALAATGGSLMRRIQRLIGPTQGHPGQLYGLISASLIVLAIVVVAVGARASVARSSAPDARDTRNVRIEVTERALALEGRNPRLLIAALGDQDWISRAAAARVLGEEGVRAATSPLIGALEDPQPWVRKEAAWALGLIGAGQAVAPLVRQLDDPDPGARELAARALGSIGDPAASEGLMAALANDDAQVREAAITALSQIGEGDAVSFLTELLGDPEPEVRRHAAMALGSMGSSAAVDRLQQALSDPDRQVREHAARSLGRIGLQRAAAGLVRALSDPERDVREAVARALGTVGSPAAVEPLIDALGDEDWQVRRDVARSLGLIGDSRARAPLERLLSEEVEPKVRLAVGLALRQLGSGRD